MEGSNLMSAYAKDESNEQMSENQKYYNVSNRFIRLEIERCEEEIEKSQIQQKIFLNEHNPKMVQVSKRSERFYIDLIEKLKLLKQEYLLKSKK